MKHATIAGHWWEAVAIRQINSTWRVRCTLLICTVREWCDSIGCTLSIVSSSLIALCFISMTLQSTDFVHVLFVVRVGWETCIRSLYFSSVHTRQEQQLKSCSLRGACLNEQGSIRMPINIHLRDWRIENVKGSYNMLSWALCHCMPCAHALGYASRHETE